MKMMRHLLYLSTILALAIATGCKKPAPDAEEVTAAKQATPTAKSKASAPTPKAKPSLDRGRIKPPSSISSGKPTADHPGGDHPKGDHPTGDQPTEPLPQVVEASPKVLELGTFSTSEKKKGTITLTNTGDDSVTLLTARASCGCTTSDFKPNTELAPGESTDITVTMDGKGRARKLEKTVTFNIDGRPPLRLSVKGETISFVEMTPDPIIVDDGTGTSVLTFTSRDGEPFKIISILPAIAEEIPTGAAPIQELTVDWNKFWDVVRTTKVTVRFDHPQCSEVTSTVRLTAEQRKRLNDIIRARREGDDLPTKDPSRPLTGDQLARYLKQGRGAQVIQYIKDGKGEATAVDRASVPLISVAAEAGDAATVRALLELGAPYDAVDRVQRSPLMHGARSSNPEVIEVLLDAGADIESRDQLGNGPLAWASGFGVPESVQILIDAGADTNVVDAVLGYTPLVWASGFGDAASITILLDAGADVEVHDVAEGRTPLMHAVRTAKQAAAVSVLLKAGAKVNAIDNDGRAALHIGAEHQNVSLEKVKLLVSAGGDVLLEDDNGLSPVDLAKGRTDDEGMAIAAYLIEVSKKN